MTTYTLKTVGAAIRAHIERKAAAAVAGGLVPTAGTEIADRVRVATGANRRSTSSSLRKPNLVTLSRDRNWPAPTRSDFAKPVKGMKIDDTAYLAQAQKYSAAREAIDGAVESAIGAALRRWKREGEKAAKGVR